MNNGYNPTARSTDPQTSHDAAQAQQCAKVYDQVLATIQAAGSNGCTLDDLAAALPHHEKISISPVPARLKEQGIIYETGTTRTGKSGRQQIVHVAYMPGEQVSIPAIVQRARRSANTATPAPQVEMVSDEMVSAYCDAVAEYLGSLSPKDWEVERFDPIASTRKVSRIGIQAALNARAGGDAVVFRFRDTEIGESWSRWLDIAYLCHYQNGDLVSGPHPDWEVQYAALASQAVGVK